MGSRKSRQTSEPEVIDITQNTENLQTSEIGAETSAPTDTISAKKVFVYLGPSVRGVINNGTIFSGSREEVDRDISERVETAGISEKIIDILRLVVADDKITVSKSKLILGGNALSLSYKRISEINEEG